MIDPSLIKIEVIYRQTGTTELPGGMQAGTPAYDIRVTHIPSGIFAQCGVSRSDFKNRAIATEMVAAALTGRWANEI